MPPVAPEIDVDLFETQPPITPILDRLASNGAGDLSVLLSGPPGTRKTALAHHIAQAMDRRLTVVRASDLLSRWVGGTEQAIAQSFAQAREREHALFFDEVDSLLFDRATAIHSWEVTQVNEMLTWLDHHPLPVIAATNAVHRLDPAVLRRFAFKIELAPLQGERAIRAFERFFSMAAPTTLRNLNRLTPGDFAAVRRQLRHAPTHDAVEIAKRLSDECTWRPMRDKLGF